MSDLCRSLRKVSPIGPLNNYETSLLHTIKTLLLLRPVPDAVTLM